jgi:hypothetical protein
MNRLGKSNLQFCEQEASGDFARALSFGSLREYISDQSVKI